MTRASALIWTLGVFLSCLLLQQAHGFELAQSVRRTRHHHSYGWQSPIEFDLRCMIWRNYPEYLGLQTDYTPARANVEIHHDDTLQVTFLSSAGTFTHNKITYDLQQFHFHHPPEHTFRSYPYVCDDDDLTTQRPRRDEFVLEMHLVHQTPDAKIAVIGVLFKLGKPNRFLNKFWDFIPDVEEGSPVGVDDIDAADLDLSDVFIQYMGSLTTTPYTENVFWTVTCGNWNTISKEQLERLQNKLPGANNRVTQPWNGRKVYLNFPYDDDDSKIRQDASSLLQSS
ncbi:hypothetical protein MPTK1_6g09000 [Marchantia polymorpha subsp. ruderalis]|uniref:Alpha-carbonic anhydrase domain-containing protein n=2 Tax=Marchantia polymorpha TaxID=3197 RepID=A0A176WCK1_MARPO|nr:hypothetical protein AXG93_669s1240 [Marchantia polymorpha subsp. ruderalis]PTQ36924.1 hypothetical protein MARPO_0060s0019 [Marchantia polymorpha]BBN14119.1 hypothetical protein Mp_6g09000 [Marchantia polymorpha subsp. ruderalis]|eukprot:PTQ36924.1 hypothetical protein MARPO_0060s0019 [Marchantia polymorpha]